MPIEDKKLTAGVNLWMDGCEERASVLAPGKVNFTMQLCGTADTQEMFEKIKKKFNEGFFVSPNEDLKGLMVKSLKEDNAHNEQRIRDLEMQLLNARKEILALKEKARENSMRDRGSSF